MCDQRVGGAPPRGQLMSVAERKAPQDARTMGQRMTVREASPPARSGPAASPEGTAHSLDEIAVQEVVRRVSRADAQRLARWETPLLLGSDVLAASPRLLPRLGLLDRHRPVAVMHEEPNVTLMRRHLAKLSQSRG